MRHPFGCDCSLRWLRRCVRRGDAGLGSRPALPDFWGRGALPECSRESVSVRCWDHFGASLPGWKQANWCCSVRRVSQDVCCRFYGLFRRAQTIHCRHAMNRLKRPDIADRMIPGTWEGDLIIGKDGASACATLVECTTRYLIIVALPLRRRADQVCEALTRRIHVLPEGGMRTLTRDQDPEIARHQRLTPGAGVDVLVAHPHSPRDRGTNDNTNQLIRRYLPSGTPIASHQPYLDVIAYELGNCPEQPQPHRSIQPTHCYHPLTPPGM